MIRMDNILVATDFGTTSESALNYGRQLARTFNARLHVIHVVDTTVMWAGVDGIAVDVAMVQAEIQDAAGERLRALLTEGDRRDLRATAVNRTGGSPAYVIAAYAKDAGIDLLIMGTHGRGGMAHMLMGSVAVVRIAPCPVLTVRSPEHEFVLPDALEIAPAAVGL
jgi:nucleotide-binding universal stress UspA family protein